VAVQRVTPRAKIRLIWRRVVASLANGCAAPNRLGVASDHESLRPTLGQARNTRFFRYRRLPVHCNVIAG
jgi:hypothetical protein